MKKNKKIPLFLVYTFCGLFSTHANKELINQYNQLVDLTPARVDPLFCKDFKTKLKGALQANDDLELKIKLNNYFQKDDLLSLYKIILTAKLPDGKWVFSFSDTDWVAFAALRGIWRNNWVQHEWQKEDHFLIEYTHIDKTGKTQTYPIFCDTFPLFILEQYNKIKTRDGNTELVPRLTEIESNLKTALKTIQTKKKL